ncbi:helix-turn-helix domain-containing protein [Paraglaciecola sp. L3A3]|uniref:helix-turn-helix domain-containing protein n=1 Tax=Paraglaciecola sp. L3A3 TaxID=2686358 RepID=UPI00131DC187|nr:helix-turn-helix domain-containing protein [Paraglaciecola sp. L3A3]
MKRSKTIHNEQYSNLIEKLCQERKRLGLSQTEVANTLKMTQSEISKIETSERRIDILEFRELLSVYRMSENLKLKQLVIEFFKLEK